MLNIALAQKKARIGGIQENLKTIENTLHSLPEHTDIIIFPELYLTGYSPKDLLFHPHFLEETKHALDTIKKLSQKTAIIVGFPLNHKNCVGFFYQGILYHIQEKRLLPSYDVFNECRYFMPGTESSPFEFKDQKIGIAICEDAWALQPNHYVSYESNPIAELCNKNADILIIPTASPYEKNKQDIREKLFSNIAKKHKKTVVMVNLIGGIDNVLFDGNSMVFDKNGQLIAHGKHCEEDIILCRI